VSQVGINVGDTRYTDLDYADDVVLFGNCIQELGSTLQHFHTVARHLGLCLSWQKTKVQNLGTGDDVGDVTISVRLSKACPSSSTSCPSSPSWADAQMRFSDVSASLLRP